MSPLLSWLLVGALWLLIWRRVDRYVTRLRATMDGAERLADYGSDDDEISDEQHAAEVEKVRELAHGLFGQPDPTSTCERFIAYQRILHNDPNVTGAQRINELRDLRAIAALGVYQDKP